MTTRLTAETWRRICNASPVYVVIGIFIGILTWLFSFFKYHETSSLLERYEQDQSVIPVCAQDYWSAACSNILEKLGNDSDRFHGLWIYSGSWILGAITLLFIVMLVRISIGGADQTFSDMPARPDDFTKLALMTAVRRGLLGFNILYGLFYGLPNVAIAIKSLDLMALVLHIAMIGGWWMVWVMAAGFHQHSGLPETIAATNAQVFHLRDAMRRFGEAKSSYKNLILKTATDLESVRQGRGVLVARFQNGLSIWQLAVSGAGVSGGSIEGARAGFQDNTSVNTYVSGATHSSTTTTYRTGHDSVAQPSHRSVTSGTTTNMVKRETVGNAAVFIDGPYLTPGVALFRNAGDAAHACNLINQTASEFERSKMLQASHERELSAELESLQALEVERLRAIESERASEKASIAELLSKLHPDTARKFVPQALALFEPSELGSEESS